MSIKVVFVAGHRPQVTCCRMKFLKKKSGADSMWLFFCFDMTLTVGYLHFVVIAKEVCFSVSLFLCLYLDVNHIAIVYC